MIDEVDPYQVLGVEPGASLLEIARARRRLAKQYHPDVALGRLATGRMERVNQAWEILSDRDSRRAWDRAHGPAATGEGAADPSQTWTEWAYPARVHHGSSSHAAATASDSRAGWWVLIIVVGLLTFILAAGLVGAALSGAPPDRAPWIHSNLDQP